MPISCWSAGEILPSARGCRKPFTCNVAADGRPVHERVPMTDELFLSFEEHPERSRQRRRHAVDNRGRNGKKKKKKKKRGRGRTFLALFLTMLLLGGLAGGAYLGYD